jgi:Leucine-rich repeat (LRR) protein
MSGCTSLTNINLESNTQLNAVAMESFFTNPPTNLATLSLPHCGLEFLSESIGSLVTLVWLGIDHNSLSVLPSSIVNLQSLRRLWLEGNLLSDAEEAQAQKLLPNCALDGNIEYER